MFDLDFISKDMKEHFDSKRISESAWKKENIYEFKNSSAYAISLIFKEKEILLFSILQWVAIGIAYYIWIQILGWIPIEVWESDSTLYDLTLNLAFLLWSIICVALAAYPISIFTGAMGASHFLRQQGSPSTIAACLMLALPNSKKLWMFHTADGWLTVDIILERLPKKDYIKDSAQRAIKEAIYYAWKIGTIGMPAALLSGKGLAEAGKESISLVKLKLWEVIRLRGGYSIACWIIGVTTYVGSIIFFIISNKLFISEHAIYTFYFWMGVPILIAVGVIKLFLRPIFVIASCKLYSDFLKETGKSQEFKKLPTKGESAFVAFIVLCIFLLLVFWFREEIGLMNILRVEN